MSRSIDYHAGHTWCGADYMYYEPWSREKINHQTGRNRASATRVVLDDSPPVWVQDDPDIERTPRDTSRDYDGYTYGSEAPPHSALYEDKSAPRWSSSGSSSSSTCSGWAIGVNESAYSAASIFEFLMHEHGVFASHHLDR